MRSLADIRERTASLHRWIADHFGGQGVYLPEKVILHFEVDVPDLLAEVERLTAENAEHRRTIRAYQDARCVHCDGVGCAHCNYGGI